MAAVVIIGAAVGGYVYSTMSQRPAFESIAVSKNDIQETVRISGLVKSRAKADLAFEKGGRITQLNVKVGDSVKAGQVLAKVDANDLGAQYAQAQSQAISAQAVLDQYKQNLKSDKYELDKIERDDTTTHQDKQIQEKKIAADEALIDSQQASSKAAQDNVSYYFAQLAKTEIKAPFDGTVSVKNNEAGETVAATVPVLSLIGPGGYQIEAYVSQFDMRKIEVGDPAEISFKPSDEAGIVSGRVTSIDPAATIRNGNSTYKITLDFEVGSFVVKPDLEADISVIINKKEGVLSVPERAVIEKDGKEFVIVEENGNDVLKEIQTGIRGGNGMIEIVSGLEEGDNIVGLGAR